MPLKVLWFRALVSLVTMLILFATFFSMAGTIAVSAYPTRLFGLSSAIVTEAGNQRVLVKDKKAKEFSCKKATCDPGEVKLDKPNIYGACCQTGTAPLTPKTQPAEPEKCKFPGEVGTPPNCVCPEGTAFQGFKGCIRTGFECVVQYREAGAGPAQVLTYHYTAVGTEVEVRGRLSQAMDAEHYQPISPVTCTKVEYR